MFGGLGGAALPPLFAATKEFTGFPQSTFVVLLLLTILFYLPIPMAIYRAYALANAAYTLERDGLRLRWGLRAEDIPLPEIEWIRPASDLGFHLPKPFLSMPGALLGARGLSELGTVEFVASEEKTLLLVAASRKIYAISPADPDAFLQSFQRAIELGSLAPLPSYSSQPVAFVARVWRDVSVRLCDPPALPVVFMPSLRAE